MIRDGPQCSCQRQDAESMKRNNSPVSMNLSTNDKPFIPGAWVVPPWSTLQESRPSPPGASHAVSQERQSNQAGEEGEAPLPAPFLYYEPDSDTPSDNRKSKIAAWANFNRQPTPPSQLVRAQRAEMDRIAVWRSWRKTLPDHGSSPSLDVTSASGSRGEREQAPVDSSNDQPASSTERNGDQPAEPESESGAPWSESWW